jgi:tRNA modification GTPase
MTVEFHELTHRGRGAISVVGVRGEEARQFIGHCFRPVSGKPFTDTTHRTIVYGIWNSTNEDLIVLLTDDQSFEVQCHGGFAAVESVKADLLSAGAIESNDDASWTFATNVHQAEVAIALESCLTQRTAKHLLQQFQLWGSADVNDATVRQTALSFATFGLKLTSPWRIVLCGRPNVGKSSLINALAGFERAIVHPTAGTTRDLVSQNTAIDGWPVQLTDSAGIRDAGNEIEKAGIAKAREVIDSADLVIHVVDATEQASFDPTVSQNRAGLIVVNKVDLCKSPEPPNTDCPVVYLSAMTGQGMDELQSAISKSLVPVVPDDGQLVPVTQSQCDFLKG